MKLSTLLSRRESLKLAGALGALSLFGCRDPQPPSAPLPPLSFAEPVVVSGALLGVWGEPDGGRVWMVGGRVEEDGSGQRHVALFEPGEEGEQGRLRLHWSGEGLPLWWIWGDGSGGLWAGGEQGAILRREEEDWVEERVDLDDEQRDKAIIWGLWGDGSGEVWAVGGSYRRGGPRGLLLRRELDPSEPSGAVWRRVEDPLLPVETPDDPTAGLNLFKIWGSRPSPGSSVWIVGEGGETLYAPSLGSALERVESPSRELMFTVHGDSALGELLAVGGYAQPALWRWANYPQNPRWEPIELGRGVTPLNGVSVSAPWAHLVGAMGTVTRLWLGIDEVYSSSSLTESIEGAEAYTLHAVWSPSAQQRGVDPYGLAPAPTPPMIVVGGDLESRREGVILFNQYSLPIVEPW